MIGGPGSVDNVLDALRVGVTYVGVLSQYSWRWPYWDDEITQLQSVLTAAGVLAAFRDDGVVFDSYLEDGYPGVFHDYASYVGWAMLERYVSEELIGAAYSSSWGGLTQNPVIKSAVTLALDAVNPHRVPTAFLQGDTIGNTPGLRLELRRARQRPAVHEAHRHALPARRSTDRRSGHGDRADPVMGRGGDRPGGQPQGRRVRTDRRRGHRLEADRGNSATDSSLAADTSSRRHCRR